VQASALARDRDARASDPACADVDSNADESLSPAAEGELDQICEESGWEFSRRSGGHLAVELDSAAGFYTAQLGRRADGALALSVAIDDSHPSNRMCEEASAFFLMRLSGATRMARAVGGSLDGEVAPRFEVVFPLNPSSSELSEAVAALSVAVRFGARELKLLANDERVARSYLARNPHSVRCGAVKAVPKNTKSGTSKGKRRAAAATGKTTSNRGGGAKRSPGTRKPLQRQTGELQ
jgi:hypothetical protein